MGVGYDPNMLVALNIKEVLDKLKSHPNFSQPIPINGESQIDFTLRVVAHLISPPMADDESTHIECINLAEAVRAMGPELNEIWNNFQNR